ncbi:chemotaxis protein histidine kinase CheA [Lysobacter niabensis]|uniref:Chemotaxis protein histidine kinase CheA n=1 Tax=Agrilutibacter niabensis TaxID=380628 RepID=A0ABU1VL65_9GAMM|nr:hypothetical protein [Lysobacter niabensis]MDR7098216.1 chemotaxis protein histidine kinase CheA [Lysobacter niabensis]
MTTVPDHHEPLDAEERDLAARLARTGPLEGPPPALDAKILAAAHAAATTRTPGRRHLAWLGVPPALVTGMGVAAAAVLALGLVWQLRPQYSGVTAHGDAGEEEVILVAEPAATASAPSAKAAPAEQPLAGAAPRRSRRAAPATLEPAPQPSEDTAKAIAASAAAADAAAAEEASASAAAQAMASAEEKREADRAARATAESGFVAEPPAAPAPAVERKTRATYTTAKRREQAANAAHAAAAAAPPPAPVAAAAPPAPAAAGEEPQTLDRIEVTGSRIKQDGDIEWARIPVSDDSRLSAAEWLERIRARRDDGDTDNARASLRLFQREYPRVHLPDDLRKLLAETKR